MPVPVSSRRIAHLFALPFVLLTLPCVPGLAVGAEDVIEEVVVLGTRRAARSTGDSPVPIDIISGDDFVNNGNTDMDSLLSGLIPSYNVNAQPISDAATLVRPANLRGLPPDSTLILVNGKRRHRSAVVAFLGGGISDGSQGPDLAVIPGIALKQVEVLRDGAAAQYGSDAIAGVINFVLKDYASGGSFEVKYGENYDGDGEAVTVAGNLGLPLTDAGFANFSLEWSEADPTSRSTQRGDAANLISAGNTAVANPVQVWGSPEVDGAFKFFGNAGLDLGNGHEVYAFGNWSERTVEGGFFFRNPNTRDGVFNGPMIADPRPGANPGDMVDSILVADFTAGSTEDNISCPTVPIFADIPDSASLAAVNADPNCYAFNLKFPGGFTPSFGGDLSDSSFAAGVRGELDNGIIYDLSGVVGRNKVDYFISNTINPNLARMEDSIPTTYDPGGYEQLERTFNFDISKGFDWGMYSDVNIAGGLEHRTEIFTIRNGGPDSFFIDPDLAAQGFGIGSNGFPGFKPEDAGEFERESFSAYLDVEADVTEKLLLGVAVRYEDYDDFGSTTNGKVTARLQILDNFAIRGAASTGFRAPTVGQTNVRNVTTAFTNGVLADEATLPPTNPISVQKGGKALDPEESVNLTFGVVFNIGALDVTVDYFNIEVEDRVALTTTQVLTAQDIQDLIGQGVSDASSFTGVRFFTNDFDTTTEGIDLIATLPAELFGGSSEFSFVFNHTKTEVDRFNPTIIGPTRVRQLEENLPENRFSLIAKHDQGPFRALLRLNYYDDYFEAHVDEPSLPIEAGDEFTVDVEVAMTFAEQFTVALGAQNLFDEEPDNNPWATEVGATYPVTSPMGFNGGFYYLRAIYSFE
ncbi:MAG: TonB-dependent receptor [Proteobacteria bacterium]|nr:TonB-dependent receptor [Pseudomonadota bacterium]